MISAVLNGIIVTSVVYPGAALLGAVIGIMIGKVTR